MLTICGIKNCNTMKKAFNWLQEHDVPYEFRDFKKDPLSPQELDELVHFVGLDVLVNKRGMTWKRLGLADKDLSDDQIKEELLDHQTMIKRPVLIRDDDAVMVGFDEDAFSGFVSDGSDQ